jgi:hypothetical protein
MIINKFVRALAVAPLFLAGAVVATSAGTAQAASPACTNDAHPNLSQGVMYFTIDTTLRAQPASECPTIGGQVSEGTHFSIWCGEYNYYGNYWVYGRVGTGSLEGWTSFDNVDFVIPGSADIQPC